MLSKHFKYLILICILSKKFNWDSVLLRIIYDRITLIMSASLNSKK